MMATKNNTSQRIRSLACKEFKLPSSNSVTQAQKEIFSQ